MSITDRENELFAEMERKTGEEMFLVRDGVADEAAFLTAPRRIVYVLKETNDTERTEKWDLRKFLSDGGRPQTWDAIARWTEGLLSPDREIPWVELIQRHEERRSIFLKRISAINLKKTPGGCTSDYAEIEREASAFSEIIRKQLALYDAELIICCGTGNVLYRHLHGTEDEKWKMTARGVPYFAYGKSTVISFAHPQARVSGAYLYYALMDAVREIRESRKIDMHFTGGNHI